MTRARVRALLLSLGVAALVTALAFASGYNGRHELPARPARERPSLLLLTSLPLLFGDDFSLRASGSPVPRRLSSRYRLVPISVTSQSELRKGRLLLMAQPRAQTPENLVELDRWVRNGGRVLLLADPLLDWPSGTPLGDNTRPPPMFMDTGLLAHWGLSLAAPDRPGAAERKLGGYRIETVSPGALSGGCRLSADRFVATCRLGAGKAIIVADADLLDVVQLGPRAGHNLDALLEELALIEQP